MKDTRDLKKPVKKEGDKSLGKSRTIPRFSKIARPQRFTGVF